MSRTKRKQKRRLKHELSKGLDETLKTIKSQEELMEKLKPKQAGNSLERFFSKEQLERLNK